VDGLSAVAPGPEGNRFAAGGVLRTEKNTGDKIAGATDERSILNGRVRIR